MSRMTGALSLSKGALLAVLLAGLLLASCTPAPAASPGPAHAAADQLDGRAGGSRRRRPGSRTVPLSDASVAPVDGGLPDVTLPCLGGGRDVRLAGLRGRPMMINIWAQWCEPCRAESRFLSETARHRRPG